VRSRRPAFSPTCTDPLRCDPSVIHHPFLVPPSRFMLSYGARPCSYTARSLTPNIAAPQNASRFLSRRSRRRARQAPTQILAHGPWMSCRSAKWEVGRRTERTCVSRCAIYGLSPDEELVYDINPGSWCFLAFPLLCVVARQGNPRNPS
jgi:hypothetical protein